MSTELSRDKVIESTLFAVPLPSKTLADWSKKIPPAHYNKGQVLFYEGHLPYGIFVIHKGKVKLDPTDKSAKPIELGPGTLVGLGLLQKNMPYPCTAVISQDMTASFLEKTLLFEWIEKKEPIVQHLIPVIPQ